MATDATAAAPEITSNQEASEALDDISTEFEEVSEGILEGADKDELADRLEGHVEIIQTVIAWLKKEGG